MGEGRGKADDRESFPPDSRPCVGEVATVSPFLVEQIFLTFEAEA
jgi:hypothetical protein